MSCEALYQPRDTCQRSCKEKLESNYHNEMTLRGAEPKEVLGVAPSKGIDRGYSPDGSTKVKLTVFKGNEACSNYRFRKESYASSVRRTHKQATSTIATTDVSRPVNVNYFFDSNSFHLLTATQLPGIEAFNSSQSIEKFHANHAFTINNFSSCPFIYKKPTFTEKDLDDKTSKDQPEEKIIRSLLAKDPQEFTDYLSSSMFDIHVLRTIFKHKDQNLVRLVTERLLTTGRPELI
jgi:hypothetical protein